MRRRSSVTAAPCFSRQHSPFWVYSCPRHSHLYVFQAPSPFAPCHASVLARVPLYHHSFFLAGVLACLSWISFTFCILMKLFGKREGTLAEIPRNAVPSSVAAPSWRRICSEQTTQRISIINMSFTLISYLPAAAEPKLRKSHANDLWVVANILKQMTNWSLCWRSSEGTIH